MELIKRNVTYTRGNRREGTSYVIDPGRMVFKLWVTGETIYDHSTIEDFPREDARVLFSFSRQILRYEDGFI